MLQSLGHTLHRNRWRRVREAEMPAQSLDLDPDFFEAKGRNAAAPRPVGHASVERMYVRHAYSNTSRQKCYLDMLVQVFRHHQQVAANAAERTFDGSE
jgi:hypothetical protein